MYREQRNPFPRNYSYFLDRFAVSKNRHNFSEIDYAASCCLASRYYLYILR